MLDKFYSYEDAILALLSASPKLTESLFVRILQATGEPDND